MFRKVLKDSFFKWYCIYGRTSKIQYSNLYCRFLEKDDAENTFITSTEGANDPKVATEDDADKSIGKLKIMNYYNCWKE